MGQIQDQDQSFTSAHFKIKALHLQTFKKPIRDQSYTYAKLQEPIQDQSFTYANFKNTIQDQSANCKNQFKIKAIHLQTFKKPSQDQSFISENFQDPIQDIRAFVLTKTRRGPLN